MKKILVLFCVFVLSTSFIGCSKNVDDTSPAMSIAQELLDAYDEIMRIYDSGNISENEDEIVLNKHNNRYFVVKNDKYKSIDDLKEAAERVLSYNLAYANFYRVFCGTEGSFYEEIDGKLCRAYGDMAINYIHKKSDIIIHHDSKDLIVFSVPPTDGNAFTENHRFYFILLNTYDGWRIDNIFEIK